jgi:hypothetical protein
MTLAAVLPRFLQAGSHPQRGRAERRAAAAALPERRTMLRNAIVTLENRHLQIRVLRGWVWITRDGCRADMVLGAGDDFEQQPGARVLVQALDEAELLIASAGAHPHNA